MNQTTAPAISPNKLENYCNQLLDVSEFKDYCPNGLQVDGGRPINKLVTGVTACQALIDAAIDMGADAIMVHHGYFWKGEPEPLVGIKGARIRKLMQHGISLLAYHLPLDAHPKLGNNAALADSLGLSIAEPLFPKESKPVGNITTWLDTANSLTASEVCQRIQIVLGRKPLHINPTTANAHKPLGRIGLCTGAAQDFIDQAAAMGCDAYISGEISERTTHSARELGIHYFACGHHATEKGGIQRLGENIAQNLNLEVVFIDIDNPV